MSRSRHGGKKASGGKVEVAGGNPEVIEEAKERKSGGKVAACEGPMAKKRMDRPRRASGGRVGADKAPLSSAHASSSPGKSAD
jgi:hypothetical protein